MADTFITKLTEVATPTKDDLAIVVDNPRDITFKVILK